MANSENSAKQSRRSLDVNARDKIGAQLRDMYNSVITEPVPDRFLDLLKSLEAKEKSEDKGSE
jgi:hypothetical protein